MKDYKHSSPDEIEQDIASTRAHIDRTLDVLTARLSPSGLMDQAMQTARDTGGEFTMNLGRTIRDNPVPAALLGHQRRAGLMLAGRKSHNGGYDYDDYAVEHAGDRGRRYGRERRRPGRHFVVRADGRRRSRGLERGLRGAAA